MALSTKYTLAAVQAAGTLISGIKNQSINFGIQAVANQSDSSPSPRFIATLRQAPAVEFLTNDVAAALGVAGYAGLRLTSGTVLNMFLQKVAAGGTREAAASLVHEKITLTEGILIPTSLQAGLDDFATIGYRAHAIYDGTNAPLILTPNQALAGVGALAAGFVAGPVSINGTSIGGIQSISVDFGIQVMLDYADDAEGQWPAFASIGEIRPRLRIETKDLAAITALGLEGVAQTGTDSLVYLRGCENQEKRYANASAQHIKIAVDAGQAYLDQTAGPHNDAQVHTIVIDPVYDGTNAIIAITTGVAIT